MWPHGAGCVWIAWAGVGGRLVESGVCSSDILELSDPSGTHVDHRCRGILAPSLAGAVFSALAGSSVLGLAHSRESDPGGQCLRLGHQHPWINELERRLLVFSAEKPK